MFNDCTFIGNLGNDPEVRASKDKGTSFTTFSIAVNNPAKRDAAALWIHVTTFGKAGEFAGQYLKKGNRVLVQGTLEQQEFEGKDGKNHTQIKLIAGKLVSLTAREAGEASAASATSGGSTQSAKPAAQINDEDIPF